MSHYHIFLSTTWKEVFFMRIFTILFYFWEETYLKYFARSKFSKFHQKTIVPVVISLFSRNIKNGAHKLTRDLIHAVQKLLIFTSIKFREFRKMRFLIIFAVANFCENEIILPKVNSLKVYMEKYDIITTNLSYQE